MASESFKGLHMKDLRLSNNFKHSYRMSAYYQCFLNHILLSVRCKASVSLPTEEPISLKVYFLKRYFQVQKHRAGSNIHSLAILLYQILMKIWKGFKKAVMQDTHCITHVIHGPNLY